MDATLHALIESFAGGNANLLVVTGEGVAAECGITPFRADPEAFSYGEGTYTTDSLLTCNLFEQIPEAVWTWHLSRMEMARRAEPGPVHRAAAQIAHRLGPRFTLITECVDGLHRRCDHPREGLFEPQGNLFYMRCAAACTPALYPIPEAFHGWTADRALTAEDMRLLRCPDCGGPARPHILWRDEIYDEPHYRLNSILDVARRSQLLIVAGFSGHTNLGNKVVWEITHNHRARIVDINPEPNPVAALARRTDGMALRASPAAVLPEIFDVLGDLFA